MNVIQNAKRLMKLLDEIDSVPDTKFLQSLKSQFQILEQRVNLLEAYLQAPEGKPRPTEDMKELRSALDQLSGAIASTLQMLQRIQESQKRGEEALQALQEKVKLLERSVQSSSLKNA